MPQAAQEKMKSVKKIIPSSIPITFEICFVKAGKTHSPLEFNFFQPAEVQDCQLFQPSKGETPSHDFSGSQPRYPFFWPRSSRNIGLVSSRVADVCLPTLMHVRDIKTNILVGFNSEKNMSHIGIFDQGSEEKKMEENLYQHQETDLKGIHAFTYKSHLVIYPK